jgi:hypothetical protein
MMVHIDDGRNYAVHGLSDRVAETHYSQRIDVFEHLHCGVKLILELQRHLKDWLLWNKITPEVINDSSLGRRCAAENYGER